MARNLGHARAVEWARVSKSESRNSSRLRDLTEKIDLKSQLPPYSIAKSQMFTDSYLVRPETQNIPRTLSASTL